MKTYGLIWYTLEDTFSDHHKLFVKYFIISFSGVAASCCQIQLTSYYEL